MANSTMASLTFVLVLLHAITAHAVQLDALVAFQNFEYAILRHRLAQEEYHRLYEGIDDLATIHSLGQFMGLRLLLPQTPIEVQPPEWILVDLVGWSGSTTLALRSDNLYLTGFTNSLRQWYAFQNSENLIPGSIMLLGINGSYASVVGKHENLEKLSLSRMSALQAVETLRNFNHISSFVNQSDLKDALAKLLLIVCEASRFKNLSDIISNGWDTESYIPTNIRKSLTSWGDTCSQILKGWPDNKYTRHVLKKYPKNLKTVDDFVGILHVLLIPSKFNEEIQLDPIAPSDGQSVIFGRNIPPPLPLPPAQPLPPAHTP